MEEKKNNTVVKYLKIGAVIAAVFVAFTEFKRCSEEMKGSESETGIKQEEVISPEEALSREKAFYASKDYVKRALAQADTLIFSEYAAKQVSVTSDKNIYFVNAQVEEKTQAGLSVIHEYKVQMRKTDERNWRCISLDIDDEKVLR